MYGSSAASNDLNLPYPTSSSSPSGFGHRKEQQQQQQQQMSSGLLRYRSAPSTLLGEVCEDFPPVRPSSPETDTMFARFLPPDLDKLAAGGRGGGQSGGGPQFQRPQTPAGMEHGGAHPHQMMYHSSPQQQQIPSQLVSSMAMEAEQLKGGGGGDGGGNVSNLIRQSSSPAGLFSHLNVDNSGYAVMRGGGGGGGGGGNFRNGNGAIGEGGMAPAPTRLKSQLSFSSRQGCSAGLMSHISELGSESMGGSSPEESGGGRYIPGYSISSWEDSPLLSDGFSSGLRRPREVDAKILPDPQNGEARNHPAGLAHQFSLPKTASEMAAIEKFLQFQDSVPCKIRAKRGCATHPRSIAERVRRTRISERMRKLQELVPNMDKQTNTADMLDLAVDYIKDLQKQVKSLSDGRASCTCSSSSCKPKQYQNGPV